MSNVTKPRIRCSIRLNEEQEKAVMEYLTRSTCFWNFLMQHLRNEFNEYIESNGSDEALMALTNKAITCLHMLSLPNLEGNETNIEEEWKAFLPQMRELDYDSLNCRARDFVDALVSYVAENGSSNAQRPKVKTERSAQAISFTKPNFSIHLGILKLEGLFPVEIEVPELTRLSFEVNEVMIGKKAHVYSDSDSKYGPAKQEGHFFIIASN